MSDTTEESTEIVDFVRSGETPKEVTDRYSVKPCNQPLEDLSNVHPALLHLGDYPSIAHAEGARLAHLADLKWEAERPAREAAEAAEAERLAAEAAEAERIETERLAAEFEALEAERIAAEQADLEHILADDETAERDRMLAAEKEVADNVENIITDHIEAVDALTEKSNQWVYDEKGPLVGEDPNLKLGETVITEGFHIPPGAKPE